jgi:hypothetical protein
MAIAPGFEYDLFVSYAHIDDEAPDGEPGWVTGFVKRLEPALHQRLGGAEALKIFFDSRATGANYRLPELLVAVKKSALLLVVGSPSYASREWPRQELAAFVEQTGDLSRLFMIECLPLGDGERYPAPLDNHIRLEFWKPTGKRNVPMPYSLVADAQEVKPLIHALAADIRNKLLSLHVLPATQPSVTPAAPPPAVVPGPPAANRMTILIAQTTDDVEDEADQLRRFLKQYEQEVTVLPRAGYPQGGDAFKAALAQDLSQSGLFVQLLGQRAGRLPPDLPEGYTRCQIDAAKAAGVEIMQWRRPDLDTGGVADQTYRAILTAETVVACGLEEFKRQVLARVRKPKPKPKPVLARSATVFINADDKDIKVAKEIERECLQHALTTILPMSGPSSEANRKDLTENLTDCDVLLFIYGDTTQDWIRSQLRFFSKIKPKREADPRLLAICSGPPPKPDIGMSFPNARIINCPDGWSLDPIRSLISELDA